jgi:mRNA interferase RelE/StbE
MSYAVKWRSKALHALRKLPNDITKRIVKKINTSQENPRHFLEKLVDDPGYKVRAGDYRAIIDILEEEKILAVRLIGHRRNIYKPK